MNDNTKHYCWMYILKGERFADQMLAHSDLASAVFARGKLLGMTWRPAGACLVWEASEVS